MGNEPEIAEVRRRKFEQIRRVVDELKLYDDMHVEMKKNGCFSNGEDTVLKSCKSCVSRLLRHIEDLGYDEGEHAFPIED